jgi:dipeptidyl aminopeptidase/acylaminoacyl peptidase
VRPDAATSQVVVRAFQVHQDFRGGAWLDDGTIVFTGTVYPLFTVPATGGAARVLFEPPPGEQSRLAYPEPVAGGRVLFSYLRPDRAKSGIYLWEATAPPRLLLPWTSSITRVALDPLGGYLHREDGGASLVVTRAAGDLTPTGGAVPIAATVGVGQAWTEFSHSRTGRLVYRASEVPTRVLLVDRGTGVQRMLDVEPAPFYALAADGRLLTTANNDVWLHEAGRDVRTRLTATREVESFPMWAPDGRRVAFQLDFGRRFQVLDLATRQVEQHELDGEWGAIDWNGQTLVGSKQATAIDAPTDLWTYDLARRTSTRLTDTPFREDSPRLSADGRYVAYTSDETGTDEVYVRAAQGGAPRRISASGGDRPMWRADGREVVFVRGDGVFLSARRTDDGSFTAPVELFKVSLHRSAQDTPRVAMSPDGRQFVVQVADGPPPPLVLIDNWRGLVTR